MEKWPGNQEITERVGLLQGNWSVNDFVQWTNGVHRSQIYPVRMLAMLLSGFPIWAQLFNSII